MSPELTSALKEVAKYGGAGPVGREQMSAMARLLALVADEQARAAEEVRKQTCQLLCLTWALVGLTVGLFLFTAYLTYDACLAHQCKDTTAPHASEQDYFDRIHAEQNRLQLSGCLALRLFCCSESNGRQRLEERRPDAIKYGHRGRPKAFDENHPGRLAVASQPPGQ